MPGAELNCLQNYDYSNRAESSGKVGCAVSALQENAIHGPLHTASAHRDIQKYP